MRRHPDSVAIIAQRIASVILLLSLAWFAISSLHWPLTGDASLMHYVVFLMDHGLAPYREIGDMNLPGAYLPNWLILHTLGSSALAWRMYDFGLLALGGGAMMLLARPANWHSGFWAAALFALIHGRDGLYQTGQRDLTMAVLLLVGTAALPRSGARCSTWNLLAFGFAVGAATTIKPVALPFLLLPLPLLWAGRGTAVWRRVAGLALGFAGPLLGACFWLRRKQALGAFLHVERTLAPFHASMGRRTLGYLLQHSVAPLMPLIGVWLLLLWAERGQEKGDAGHSLRRRTLLLGALLGCAAYVVQGRGYPYHRYAAVGFLLCLLAHDLDQSMRLPRALWIRGSAAAAFSLTALLVGGISAVVISRYDTGQPEFRETLRADLADAAGGEGLASLAGKVQCLDTVAGCIDTLNHLHLLQSTGTLYDEFLFHAAGSLAVDESRARFWAAVQARPPAIFVMTEPLFPTGPDGYRKLEAWPEFAGWLQAHYVLTVERPAMRTVRTGGAAFRPPGYRLYIRR